MKMIMMVIMHATEKVAGFLMHPSRREKRTNPALIPSMFKLIKQLKLKRGVA